MFVLRGFRFADFWRGSSTNHGKGAGRKAGGDKWEIHSTVGCSGRGGAKIHRFVLRGELVRAMPQVYPGSGRFLQRNAAKAAQRPISKVSYAKTQGRVESPRIVITLPSP
jgi:hypothetical protein